MKDLIKRELNKWQWLLHYGRAFEYRDKRRFMFGIFEIQKFPEEGKMLSKECYKGFLIRWNFNHPLTILRKYLEHKGF